MRGNLETKSGETSETIKSIKSALVFTISWDLGTGESVLSP
jgi:hypothetical protein